MWFRKYKKRIFSCLLSLVICLSFVACAGETSEKETSREEASVVSQKTEGDIFIPEEITMEFFGLNLLHSNRPMWEQHIYSIYDVGKDDLIGTRIPIGNYEVMHSSWNFENMENFSAVVTYNNDFGGSQILFDENDKLTKIDIRSEMGEEFSTSFLNIGDNVKDYFEASKEGLWNKFLSDEPIAVSNGWNIRHATASATDFTYDDLQVYNKDIYISYLIKDQVVDYIIVNVIGDIALSENSQTEGESSIYELGDFKFYVKGKEISKMSGSDWVNSFSNSFEEIWREFLGFSEKNSKFGDYRKEARTVVDGLEINLNYTALEDRNWMFMGTKSVSKLKNDVDQNDKGPFMIEFSLTKDGVYSISLYIHSPNSLLTCNYVMPGDNIREFLDSYEEGLFEKIVSLSDSSQEYTVGPYYFSYFKGSEGEDDLISIGKRDDSVGGSILMGLDQETITWMQGGYQGRVSGYEDEPTLR